MRHYCIEVQSLAALQGFLVRPSIREELAQASSVLMQFYTAKPDPGWILGLVETVLEVCPSAVVTGATTMGEVEAGRTLTGTTIASLSIFATTRLGPILLDGRQEKEVDAGRLLGAHLQGGGPDLAGVLLLAATDGLNLSRILQALGASGCTAPLFGGIAGDYKELQTPCVFLGRRLLDRGIAAVGLYGPELRVSIMKGLGWVPLSPRMTITDADGLVVRTVDDAPAFEVYRHYLGLEDPRRFFMDALEFPFLIHRDGEIIARAPARVGQDGALHFLADVHTGETFTLGYGDLPLILGNGQALLEEMLAFAPQGLFLFTCICRRALMERDVDLETLPLGEIAPTAGFYTFGEVFGKSGRAELLNCTQVTVGLREGPPPRPHGLVRPAPREEHRFYATDPYMVRHVNAMARLMHFATVITGDLERSNRELHLLSITDKLTQLQNRARMDTVLAEEIARATRYGQVFSLILMDLDHFKRVNDHFGHPAGDAVLSRLGAVLRRQVRASDIPGRWGGEEFVVVLPGTPLGPARQVAEKIREAVASEPFPRIGRMTASFGVVTHQADESLVQLLIRVDEALYRAKERGRNCVE